MNGNGAAAVSLWKKVCGRALIVAGLAGLVWFALDRSPHTELNNAKIVAKPEVIAQHAPSPVTSPKIPKLVDLGASQSADCKLMAPVLEDLRASQAGKLEVLFIDVQKDADAAKVHNVQSIPTQIFFGPDGRELFRHEGFYSKDEIVAKWKALGYELMVPWERPAFSVDPYSPPNPGCAPSRGCCGG